ncbi:MAG TPA: DUF2207 domain-containing protein [Actinomycetaceae bacterium]|nr:DUF2207 domain-containing protein [Actinomycetaceae bacterium]
MRSRLRHLLAALLTLGLLLGLPGAAHAARNDVIRELDIHIELDSAGTAHVTENYTWDFGSRQGLGFTRMLAQRFDYDPQPDKVRVYEYGNFGASSTSGAPAGVWTYDEGAWLRADVGAPDGSSDRRSGVQHYTLTYTIDGALNAVRGQSGVNDQDELYWNATGNDWEIPVEAATVRVTGPTDVVDMACYAGPTGSDEPCESYDSSGNEASGAASNLQPGSGLTIMAAYPAGTFTNTDAILVDADTVEDHSGSDALARFLGTHWPWVVPLGLALPVAFGLRRRAKGRDLHFEGVAPGIIPPDPNDAPVSQLKSDPAVAVRFTPPDGLRPAEVGVVRDTVARGNFISATIIDLAVRGYLTITETKSGRFGRPDWVFTATPENAPTEQLRDYELTLLRALFRNRTQVALSKLRNTFASTMRSALNQLRAHVTGGKAFVGSVPTSTTGTSGGSAVRVIFFVLFGIVVFSQWLVTLASSSSLVLVLILTFIGLFILAAAVTAKARRQRTAVGRALYEQSRGFEMYLTTAEAHQIRFEEGEDIFSRYLPYAMVFGVAERWARIFEQLQAEGLYHHTPTWYVGVMPGPGSFTRMSQSMNSFGSTATSTLASTPGSSGGSGSFGGGGGFSGGGGGGGGGGGR